MILSRFVALSASLTLKVSLFQDLSWCRELTDEGLGILTDRCTRLKRLKVWGCTQLTSVFLEGHARHDLEIVGRPSRPPLRTQDA